MRLFIKIVAVVSILLALPILVAGPGTRLGLWDYSLGLTMMREVAAPKAIAGGISLSPLMTAAALALIAGLIAFFMKNGRLGLFALFAALFAGAALAAPLKMKADFAANPFIHEVTTDFDNPPAIIAAADLPRKNPAGYRGGDPVPQRTDGLTVAEAQRAAFPDILPIIADAKLSAAADAAKAVISDMGMEVLADGPADGAAGGGWRIEAVATSLWFGFKDDFVVRLTSTEGDKTRVDVRSKSRVGGSDLGANAKRVREFARRFNAAIGSAD